ncbi:cytochrome c biogenesis protein ResB [Chloroflexota bacterium]
MILDRLNTAAKEDKKQQGPGAFKSVVDWLWHLFSSLRLAVILILVITGLSLLGALLIQAPSDMARDPQLYSYWIDTAARSKVGGWVPLLSALHLFDVFHSPWFLITGTLLMLNIFICSVNRWSNISLSLRGGAVKQKESFYTTGHIYAELSAIPAPVAEAAMTSEKVLRARGYRTRAESGENNVYIAADKNRYYRLGTYLSHFSLILFVLAFITGSYFGFRDSSFTVTVGSNREIGYNTGLSLQLTSFVDEYYGNGMPKDYRSQVVLFENGQAVKQALIRVNHPLIYKGTRIYQAYFGPAVKMLVRDENGQDIFNGNVPLDGSFYIQGYQRYEGFFDLPEVGFSIRLISPAVNTVDPMIPAGQLAVDVRQGSEQIDIRLVELGTPRVVSGLEFTFLEESKYSGFQVSQDPTNMLIWIASTLFIIGICAVLYFPYRQVWVLSQPLGQENSCLLIRMLAPRSSNGTSELNTLVNQMEKELPTPKINKGK